MIISGMNTMEGVPEVITWPTRALKAAFDIGTRDSLRALGIPVNPDLEFIYIYHGRVYLIVDSMAITMMRLPGFRLESAGVKQEAVWSYLPDEITRPRTLWEKLQGILIAGGTILKLREVNRILGTQARAQDIAQVEALGAQVAGAVSSRDLANLAEPMVDWMSHLFKVHLLASMMFTQGWTRLEQVCQKAGVDPSLVVADSGGIVSSRVVSMLHHLAAEATRYGIDLEADGAWQALNAEPAMKKLLEEFLETCGHRGFNEMEFATPRFREEPDAVLVALRAQTTADPRETARRAKQAGWSQVSGSHRRSVARRVEEAQSKAALREATKDTTVRMANVMRQWFLKASETLPDPQEIWLMTIEEIALWLRLRVAVKPETLDQRRADLKTWRSLPPIETLFVDEATGVGHTVSMTGELVRKGELRGMIASRGLHSEVEGRAVVAREPQAALEKIKKLHDEGEQTLLLITRVTNVAWTAAFGSIGGIITEVGGVGSHAAIVAREYGIPALVGVPQAVSSIPDGTVVRLDCEQGIIQWKM
jgi:phosphohistidine swiveling domain-containing protein